MAGTLLMPVALPQVMEIRPPGSTARPKVSPGQIPAWLYAADTLIAGPSQPRWMENGRR
jgi:hypothetical protein